MDDPFTIVLVMVVVALLWPCRYDPAIQLKKRQLRRKGETF